MKSGKWFCDPPEPQAAGALDARIKALLGAAVGGLAFALGATHLAIMVWVITAIGTISLSSHRYRTRVGRVFTAAGQSLGWLIGVLLLTPVYLLGFSLIHLVSRLSRRDPLRLRDTYTPTYWLPADHDWRKVRYIGALFATERTALNRRGCVWQAAVSLVTLLVVAEVTLRWLGFGSPILYVADARTGYHPAPHQRVHRYGGYVATNRHGMRRPDFDLSPDPGTLRILLLGDSTLWGGSNIDQPDLYARRVESALNQQVDHRRVEVLNMGVNGWGPFNKLGFVEMAGTFDAEIAVICLPIEDVYRDFTRLSDLPYFTDQAPPRFALEEVLCHFSWRTRIWWEGEQSGEQRLAQAPIGTEAYVSLGKLVRETGCEVLFEILPSREAGTGAPIPDAERRAVALLRSALEQNGFTVGYPVRLFAGEVSRRDVYQDRCHLRTRGHAIYARYLESRLLKRSRVLRAWVTLADQAGRIYHQRRNRRCF